LAPFFTTDALGQKAGLEFAQRVLMRLGMMMNEASNPEVKALFDESPQWLDLAIRLLSKDALRGQAMAILRPTKTPKALDPLLDLVRSPLPNDHVLPLIDLLAQYRDARLPAAFIRLFNMLQSGYQQLRATEVFAQYDDANLGSMLRYWLEERKSKRKMSRTEIEPIEQCIRHLLRDRSVSPKSN
jgi:hypothetical protein